jgi:hypothetical protein
MFGHERQLTQYSVGHFHQPPRATVIWQNLSILVSVIVTLVDICAGFSLPLPLGVVGHEGSTVAVCLNGCGSWHSAQMEALTSLNLGYELSCIPVHP